MSERQRDDAPHKIRTFSAAHALWPAYVMHLGRNGMAQWALDDDGAPLPATIYLGAVRGDEVVGHLTLRHQPIVIPATEWTDQQDMPLRGPGGVPLMELFVQTFAVDDAYRRRGVGRTLQLAALDAARERDCCQVRSWSSLDKTANFALKISLGFGVHPAVQVAPGGEAISGAYFILRV